MFSLYMVRYSDDCHKSVIGGTSSIPSPPPFPCNQREPPSLCCLLSGRFLPGCKAGGLAAPTCPPRQAFPFPSVWTSGTEAASPTQSLLSLPKRPVANSVSSSIKAHDVHIVLLAFGTSRPRVDVAW